MHSEGVEPPEPEGGRFTAFCSVALRRARLSVKAEERRKIIYKTNQYEETPLIIDNSGSSDC